MGRPLAAKLAELPAGDRALLDAYAQALRRAGCSDTVFASGSPRRVAAEAAGASTLGNRLGVARRFLARWGLEGWLRLTVEEQVAILTATRPKAIGAGMGAFACWLALTGRLPFPPGLLEALESHAPTAIRWIAQGRLAHPELTERVAGMARKLGYCGGTADQVCHVVAKAAAYARKTPEALTLDDLVTISDAIQRRRAAGRAERGERLRGQEHQPLLPWTTGTVLYHAGLLPEPPSTDLIGRRPRRDLEEAQLGFLRERWPQFHAVAVRYLAQRNPTRRPATIETDTLALGAFFRWLTSRHPMVTDLRRLDRRAHIEPFLRWVLEEAGPGRRRGQERWSVGTRHGMLGRLRQFFHLLALWGWPEAPTKPLLFPGDLPRLPDPLPKAFDDVEAARMVKRARGSASPIERLIIELLAGCGLRVGEARELKLSDLLTFGGAPGQPGAQAWLRIPLGKLANDRYVPVGPALQAALDSFLAAERSRREWDGLPAPPPWTAYLLARKGRRVSAAYGNRVVQQIAELAAVADAHAHRWRHTFATQAINRGMDLASIATLLGHRCLEMTMVYARIASPTLRLEFERVSRQVQAFYAAVAQDPAEPERPVALPAGALGPAMVTTRRELEWRRLGNGWCTRRAYLDCRHELVCERCVHFNTERMFLPILEAQHEDAARKGQQARVALFAKLIASLEAADHPDEPLPVVSGPRVADFSDPDSDPKAGALA
jgi:site-specific recombinase XerD